MKNVLFATTALVAFAGVASAEATVDFSGEINAGYNDVIEGGLFWSADLDALFTVDLGDNVAVTASATLLSWSQDSSASTADLDYVEVAYTGGSFTAALKYGDLGDKGASEYYYSDRDGMAIDVENHDGTEDVRAMVTFGAFGVAVGCDNVSNGDCDDGFSVGLGATFGSIELGVGYDEADSGNSDGGNDESAETIGVSADATFGAMSVGVSYATAGSDDSIGVAVGYTISDALSVGAYYALNNNDDDAYGVSVDYSAGALTVGAYYDGVSNGGQDEFGVDASYAVTDMLTANAGMFNDGTTVFYVGIDYAVNDNITATVSYADADEISGPEYKEGISAFITATF